MAEKSAIIPSIQEATDGTIREESVEAIRRMREESEQASRPRRSEWDKAWNLYNGAYDFSNKAPHQSKARLPRVNTSVRIAAYMMKRGLVGPRDFFQTDGIGSLSKELSPHIHKLAKYHLAKSKFVSNYTTSLISGMLSSLVILKVYPKIVYEDEVTFERSSLADPLLRPQSPGNLAAMLGSPFGRIKRARRKRLCVKYDPVSAYDLHLDPRGDNLYKIHTMEIDYHKFVEMAHARGFDQKVVSQVTEDYVSQEKRYAEAARAGQEASAPPQPYRKRVRLDEFWGDLLGRDGTVLFRNCYAVVVNEKYTALSPRPNRLPGGKDPFIYAPVIERPFSTWHQGFVETVSDLQLALTELMNIILDGSLYASIKAFEVDIDQVYDPNEFIGGIFPGKAFKKRGGVGQQMIRDISLGNFNPQVMEIFLALEREFNNGLGLNEFILPQFRVRTGRVTATEVQAKGSQAGDFFSEIARNQEENLIEPLLERTYQYTVHYQRDFTDPLLVELLGAEAASKAQLMLSDSEVREFLASSPMRFKASGLSELANRMKELDKILAFINLIGMVAKNVPQIIQRVKIDGLLKKAIQGFNWNEEEIMSEEQPVPMPPPTMGGGSPEMAPTPIGAPPPIQPEHAAHGGMGPLAL